MNRGETNRGRSEVVGKVSLPDTVNLNVTQKMDDAQVERLRTEISGLTFALAAFANSANRKLDAIAKKLEDPTSGELAQIVRDLKGEADSFEEMARKHEQPAE